MNRKISEDAPFICWKLLLNKANFRTGSYSLKTAIMNARNVPGRKKPFLISSRPSSSSSAIATEPMISISGELTAAAATERRLARKNLCAAFRYRPASHDSIPKAFTIRLPVMVSWRMFWTSPSLSCPLRVVDRTCRPIFRDEYRITGTNSSSTHANRPPMRITTPAVNTNVKNCCRNSAITVDIADCTFSMSFTIVEINVPVVCLEKNALDRRKMVLYKSSRRSVTIPKPA